jgi:hypothetical protein
MLPDIYLESPIDWDCSVLNPSAKTRAKAEEQMCQILFKKAMNIKIEKVVSQITEEEIKDEIEVLTTLDLIEEEIKNLGRKQKTRMLKTFLNLQ